MRAQCWHFPSFCPILESSERFSWMKILCEMRLSEVGSPWPPSADTFLYFLVLSRRCRRERRRSRSEFISHDRKKWDIFLTSSFYRGGHVHAQGQSDGPDGLNGPKGPKGPNTKGLKNVDPQSECRKWNGGNCMSTCCMYVDDEFSLEYIQRTCLYIFGISSFRGKTVRRDEQTSCGHVRTGIVPCFA